LQICTHLQADTAVTSSEPATNEAKRAKTSLEKALAAKQMAEERARKAANAGECRTTYECLPLYHVCWDKPS
jgi:hypothetical protein